MAITATTEFDRVRLSAGYGSETNYIDTIALMNDGARVEWLEPIRYRPVFGWDPTTAEFVIVREAVESGEASVEYVDKQGGVYGPDEDLPGQSVWMLDADPIKREIDLASSITADDRPPVSLIIYTAAVSAPTEDPPEWSSTNNTWLKWRAALETAGYYIRVPTTEAGEVVWSIKATYGREQGLEYTHFDSWRTGGRRYSLDNGRTWSTTPPSGASQITHVQSYNAVRGQWESEPYSPEYQGVATALTRRSTGEFTQGNRFIQAASLLPRKFITRGLQWGNTTHVGLRVLLRTEWLVEPILRGYEEIPDDLIPLTAPHEVSEGDVVVPVAGKTMLVAMRPSGALEIGLVNSIDRLNDYLGDHPRFLCYWLSNPIGKLKQAVSVTDTTLRYSVKPTGISTSSTVYLSDDEHIERVRPTSVSQTPVGEGDDAYYEIVVHRGPGGNNPARAWPVNTRVTADHPTQQHAELVITAKREMHAASELHIWQILDQ